VKSGVITHSLCNKENEMVQDEMMIDEEEGGGLPTGAIIATALAAGFVAFMIRRSRQQEEQKLETAAEIAAAAWEKTQDADLRGRAMNAGRDFMFEHLLPEMKPVLLDLLRDIKAYVDEAFKRAEKSVKDM
jgi:hypothetical protein